MDATASPLSQHVGGALRAATLPLFGGVTMCAPVRKTERAAAASSEY
jgi:hypothetical protein